MKFFNPLLVSIFLVNLVAGGVALSATEPIVDIEPNAIFIPVGFDDNDEVVVVVDGYLKDTCYRLRNPEVTVNLESRKVLVQPKAAYFSGWCMDVTVPYTQVVRIGSLQSGKYVVETKTGKIAENLEVTRATTTKPDDFLYAPVDSVKVKSETAGKTEANLFGRFTSTCLKLTTVKVINSGKSLEVLPIMEQTEKSETGAPCEFKEVPFERKIELPTLNPGRYLLHVRSLNGQSVNEVFNAF